jgi:hypothetical protein
LCATRSEALTVDHARRWARFAAGLLAQRDAERVVDALQRAVLR